MHHDPSSAQLAFKQYEAELEKAHEKTVHRRNQRYALGRMAIAVLFISFGLYKALEYRDALDAIENAIAAASVVLPIAIAVEVIGGLFLLIGFQARATAAFMVAYLAAVTLLVHHDISQPVHRAFALANLAFAGGLLLITAHGAGLYSVDHWRRRQEHAREQRLNNLGANPA